MNTDSKLVLTYDEWEQAKHLADERMKARNGHQFVIRLKTRCVNCGRGRAVKTRCGGWFQTFVRELDIILVNLDREREAGFLK